MYRDGKIYDEIDIVIVNIFLDYGIKTFPVDVFELCKKMSVALVPYSEFSYEERKLLMKKSNQGFFVKQSKTQPPTIYYNDLLESKGAIRLTILHELKHYIFNDDNDDDDDLADYFARHFMGPIAFLILKQLESTNEIVSFCGMSISAATNAYKNIVSRKKKYGMNLFDYEIALIEHLDPVLIEIFTGKIIETEYKSNWR
ncbi:MAG: ImmA/IrrE family metallo-endopeptidase [Lachnospiraceae bacterium]|nr:ImmA/IrrE family metallo-endopeptidase [Lachnospiraceae bacterium]